MKKLFNEERAIFLLLLWTPQAKIFLSVSKWFDKVLLSALINDFCEFLASKFIWNSTLLQLSGSIIWNLLSYVPVTIRF